MSEVIDIFNLEEVNLGITTKKKEKYYTRIQVVDANRTERCITSTLVDSNTSEESVSNSEEEIKQVEKQEIKSEEEINKTKVKRRKKVVSGEVSKAPKKNLVRNIDSTVSKTCVNPKFENDSTSQATSVYTLLFDSRRLYDSCIYQLRQRLFVLLSTNENAIFDVPYTYTQLYKIMKKEDAYINTTLDTNVKQYVVKQAIESWTSFTESLDSYVKNPEKFTGKPRIPKYLKSKKIEYNTITIDKTIYIIL